MIRFKFPGEIYRLQSQEVQLETGHTWTVIACFYPSYARKYNPNLHELRVLLVYHFVMAFRCLHGVDKLPCCAKRILSKCRIKGYDAMDKSNLPELIVASRISKILSESYQYRADTMAPPSQGFAGDIDFEKTSRESETFDILAAWLALLLRKPQEFDLFGIFHTLLILPNIHFHSNPIYSQLVTALNEQDIQHDHWFRDDKSTCVSEPVEKLSEVSSTVAIFFLTLLTQTHLLIRELQNS
ncbi:hypothetical protein BJX70DRAFT_269769 [Aspergillus crustosus]